MISKIKGILEFIKKNYMYVNITFLLLAIYIILFPLIAAVMEKINPNITKCTYLMITEKPCPLCGGTRYIRELYHNIFNIKYYIHPFGFMMLFFFFELIFRIYNLVTKNKQKSTKYINIDIIIHLTAIDIFFIYEFLFILIQNLY